MSSFVPSFGPRSIGEGMVEATSGSLFYGPAVTEPIFRLDAIELWVDCIKFFADIAHVGIDSVVGDEALHRRIHQRVIGYCMTRNADQLSQHTKLCTRKIYWFTTP